jgi:hypothetical protein
VFVWATRDSDVDGGFAAGLIAGDGHFWVRPNNSGGSWACGLKVSLRADDTPLLAQLCRWSGAGSLSAIPARNGSKPQTQWVVRRQADCLRVVSILDRHGLLGKKLGEYEIWRAAVEAWTGTRADRKRVLGECAQRLRVYRSADNVPAASEVHISTDRLLAFLAGFVTAEAHFGATAEGHPFLTINLRRDDGDLLRLFRDRLAIGRLVPVRARGTSRAALSWRVARLTDLRVLVRHLDRYPPRGRVLRIYEVWRQLVLLEDRRSGRRRELAASVRERRAYKPNLGNIVAVDRLEERRVRHLAVLKAWASATDPPRTATSYDAWRRGGCRDAPKRETIVAAFGSWIAALQAAGLSVEGCRSPDTNAIVQARAAAARPARVARHRAVILATARQCAEALGRLPSATEFFRWRNRFAPDAPSHTTVYRAFPDGWQSAVDQLEAPAQPVHVAPAAREELAAKPGVEAGAAGQLGHEGVAGHEVAAGQRH